MTNCSFKVLKALSHFAVFFYKTLKNHQNVKIAIGIGKIDFFTMPGADDWITSPLTFVDQAFKTKGECWPQAISVFFNEKLAQIQDHTLTSINETPNHALIDGQVATFRGMIQDMFDPEIYMEKYGKKNLNSGEVTFETCRFRDTTNFGLKEELDPSAQVVHGERHSYYCVSIPGEAPWVKAAFQEKYPKLSTPSTSVFNGRQKRGRDDDEDGVTVEMEEKSDQHQEKKVVTEEKMETNETTKVNVGAAESKSAKGDTSPSLNLPIPKSKGHGVIVKLYDIEEGVFKLNDVVEFTGIVSLDPILAQEDKNVDEFMKPEIEAKNPPPSLVPRLHVLKFAKLSHNNPNLPQDLSNTCLEEFYHRRAELLLIFRSLLFGDTVAAEYLICHLLSQIYTRKDSLCLGKFSLNLFNVPKNYAKRLFTVLQLLLTKSHHLPLTVDNLNKLNFVPKKDYNVNRLSSGLLQLSNGTHLMVDETVMSDGQLNAEGVRNLTALGQTIKFQSLPYDFGYHNLSFDTDIPCLVLSEGRSMLPQDVQLMLKPEFEMTEEYTQSVFAEAGQLLDAAMLNRLRDYLTVVGSYQFELTDEAQNFVQEDFVSQRQNPEAAIKTSDDLHSLLVLARFICLSRGEKTLTPNIWNEAKSIEKERKQRSAHLPTRPQPM